jgi:peptidoglycan-associated lipoprotein
MKRRVSTLTIAALLGLATLPFAAACAKKTPTTTQEARPPVAAKPEATPVPPPPKPAPTDETVDISVLDLETLNKKGYLTDVFFDFDQSDLREDARSTLATNAQWLKKHPSVQVLIEGHCDERGTAAYNLALGDRRANAAKEYLASLGIDVTRLRTVSYGKERPFCTESNESCWQKNRRDHVVITAK